MSYLGTVNVIETYSDWEVHSPSITIKVPSVIVNRKFLKKKTTVRFSRATLLLRDDFTCQYCGDHLTLNQMTIDHVVPRVRGGVTRWDNVSSACYSCNSTKGHRTSIKPFTIPRKPDYHTLLNNARKIPIEIPDESWITYLGWDENLITIRPPKKEVFLSFDDD
jgi:5-methylcytosine-specific restriction endonuclease McrA